MLEFRVFNVAKGTQPLKGRLPVSPGSSLAWFGFSEEGQLSSYDSKVSSVLLSYFVTTWLVLRDIGSELVSEIRRVYWGFIQAYMVAAGFQYSGSRIFC